MICKPCKLAGRKLGLAKTFDAAGEEEAKAVVLAQARAMHAECDYPDNCPCHHHLDLDVIAVTFG